MEPNSELQMKLRQRRARMGEDASLVDIVNTMPEQEAPPPIEFLTDVKVKQRRCMFEGAENLHSNVLARKKAAQNLRHPQPLLTPQGAAEELPQPPRAPPLRSTSPVNPPLCTASPPLRSSSPVTYQPVVSPERAGAKPEDAAPAP